MNKKILILAFITLISLFLRIYGIEKMPMILNRDEAALAYNGFLLSQTLKDEWQQTLPLALESFGDYKLLGYPLVLSVLFKFLPATDFVVKLPSILAGSFLPLIIYFFTKTLFKITKNKYTETIAILSALMIAINPIFIFYSRIAFEANLALFFQFFGLTLLLKFYLADNESKTKKTAKINLFFGGFLYFLATITYNTPLLLIPFFILGIVSLYQKNKTKSFFTLIGLLVLNFVIIFSIFAPLTKQKSSITIFTDSYTRHLYINYRDNLQGFAKNFDSQYIFFAMIIKDNLINTFSYKFLVTTGGQHPWHNIPEHAHFFSLVYFIGIFSIIYLCWQIIKNKLSNKVDIFLIFILLSTLVPAVITVDAPHATRSLSFFVIFVIISSYIFTQILESSLTKFNFKKTYFIYGFFASFLLIQSINYLNIYLNKNIAEHRQRLLVGFDEFINKYEKENNKDKSRDVAIVDSTGYQYILLAWYLKVSPEEYFKTVVRQNRNAIGFRYGEKVLNYHFIADEEDRKDQKAVIKWNEKELIWEQL